MKLESLPNPPLPDAPAAPKHPHVFTAHGVEIHDDYAWIKAENWKDVLKDPAALPADIRAYLEAENAFAAAAFAGQDGLRDKLIAEMRGRIKEDDASVPEPDGPFAYFTRYREGGQHPLVCRTPRAGGSEQVMLDGDREAQGHAFFDLGGAEHSPDHRFMAWGCDIKGSEYFTIRVRDIEAATDLPDEVPGSSGSVVWQSDSAGFYYIELDENHRPVRVRRHRLGTPHTDDAVVYEEKDPGFFVKVGSTQSDAYVLIEASDHETSEVWLLDRRDPTATPRLVEPRTPRLQYDVEHHGDDLIILTNADGAEDFKIMTAPRETPGREHWRDLVPYKPGVMILFAMPLVRHLIRLEREDAKPRIVVRDFETGRETTVAFDEETYSLGIDPGYEYDTTTIRYRYSSLRIPSEVMDYDLLTGERALRKQQEVPSGHDPSLYVTRRLFATAPDGEQVPISLLHRREVPLDGSAPCLLYGYGSYGMSMPAGFRTSILSLVDRGFVYAIAHVRGGTEKGWRWYLEGKRERKPNTFTDFIACGETLIKAGYTARGRIVAHGGSAGGMLMGAVANLAPSLFAGIVAEVPFVDVLNTMLDAELPLTPPEWPEWGNPGSDEAAFRTILAYSPYDNVKAQNYPAILALAGLTDPRVTYWEPAKWVARLRDTMTGGGPVVLRLNMDAGHGGAAGRFDRLEEVALAYAFAIKSVTGFQT
ncbi:S9 family peptidase [Microvirga pudoricolor]|uniref:S9 family peptidase n=1 Tax=Microvirga pudoricolor TaxID=2778729 RepID=UPI00194F01EB|nr:S9 family peptidase [Microvirga pudoricolor]MBM6592415.1 S9 family peptidase [Microvirga pudoricolor]